MTAVSLLTCWRWLPGGKGLDRRRCSCPVTVVGADKWAVGVAGVVTAVTLLVLDPLGHFASQLHRLHVA